jgi:hypothetical protein
MVECSYVDFLDGWLGLYFGVAIVDPRDVPEQRRLDRDGQNVQNGRDLGNGSRRPHAPSPGFRLPKKMLQDEDWLYEEIFPIRLD